MTPLSSPHLTKKYAQIFALDIFCSLTFTIISSSFILGKLFSSQNGQRPGKISEHICVLKESSYLFFYKQQV